MSQILAGWGVGLALIVAFLFFDRTGKERFAEQSAAIQIPGLLSIGIILIFASSLTVLLQDTDAGTKYIAQEHLSDIIRFSSLFTGFVVGYVMLRRKRQIRVKAIWWKQIIKLVVCVFSLFIFMNASEIPEAIGESSLPGRLSIAVINLVLALWVIYAAPLLFLKLRLVEEEHSNQD
jgi:hypothetical protein